MNYSYSSCGGYTKTNEFLKKVYQYMALGVLVTAFIAYWVSHTVTGIQILRSLNSNPLFLWLLFGFELIFVWFFAGRIFSLGGGTGLIAFLIYSAVNGLTLGSIFLIYASVTIFKAFTSAFLLFFFLGFIGSTSNKNFASAGRVAMAGLFAIIITSIINVFIRSDTLSFGISILGVIIFGVLILYDTQKLTRISQQPGAEKFAVLGAFTLYLDFINIFLYLLNIFARTDD